MDIDEGLMLRPDGRPGNPVRYLVLDDWHRADPSSVAAAAARVADSLSPTVGMATRRPPDRLRPLLDALTLTLAAPDVEADAAADARQLVSVEDPRKAFDELADIVEHHPQASIALGQLLRQTPSLGTLQGLAAEAAAYSMLLGGTEFAAWLDGRGTARPGRGQVRAGEGRRVPQAHGPPGGVRQTGARRGRQPHAQRAVSAPGRVAALRAPMSRPSRKGPENSTPNTTFQPGRRV
ncbi:hypothetical protein [Streptomyces sp. V4I2]|uniref:hypothetical protein n=1 Tax=Streptomyces sp. V4I2 TaxID=3042280 RepID=UPI002780840A|nr:hypothetical protein [Streptomyces sp. V4I2]MDQ1050437.1 hypothetical protein [Streptomyces sp. V4I2]